MTERKKRGKFEVTWEAQDGYCGGARPHSFNIYADDLEEDMDDAAIRELFEQALQDDFAGKVSPASDDEDSFVEWAKKQIAKRSSDD